MHNTSDKIPSLAQVPTPIERLVHPIHRIAGRESAAGIALLLATVVALVWANSPWREWYHLVWELPFRVAIGEWALSMTLHQLINDGLMVVFFFLVGLEIKRELLIGELASPRAAALPIAGALGGMVVPAILYAILNGRGAGAPGWGIPMATDIAFAVGVLTLLGPRAPLGLKVFLTALAIVDDLGAVVVIAVFYTADLNFGALGVGALFLAALVLINLLGVRHSGMYVLLGLFVWLAFLYSGVHATVAGVLLAMTVPARTRINSMDFLISGRALLHEFDQAGEEGSSALTNGGQQWAIQMLEDACEKVQAPLVRLEHDLRPWVSFGIIPIFAFSNAGVGLDINVIDALVHPVTLGVILGLVLGKPVGITFFAWLTVRLRLAVLPAGVTWRALHAVSWLGGIGFTMSLFIAGLAFGEGSELLEAAKIGILGASALAAIAGGIWLRAASSSGEEETESAPPAVS